MIENKSSYYNLEQMLKLKEYGVIIPDLSSVKIGLEVPLEKISAGSILYPFVRINGSRTEIHSGASIGLCGPTFLYNSWIGENAIVGNLGGVTLKDTVVGPGSILGSGVAEDSVLLGKETNVNDFTTGYGFRIRKGTLYEEDASSAQHTDTKMTILFPWVTLGSNINFCDLILAGGTGPEPCFFSEAGSGSIHFNYSVRGDKATSSIFGDVKNGVFLDQKRIFIGGNSSLIGPIKAEYGAMNAAGVRINGNFVSGLNFGHSLPKGKIDYDPSIFLGVMNILRKQIHVIAELTALLNWYQQIRISCFAKTQNQKFIYNSAMRIIELNFQERIAHLQRFVEAIEVSQNFILKSEKVSNKEVEEQKLILKCWPEIHKKITLALNFEVLAPNSLREDIANQQDKGKVSYTKIIQNLSTKSKKSGKSWLKAITTRVIHEVDNKIKKG